MEHDFEPDGPVKDGWRDSICTKCKIRIRVPEEGTVRALSLEKNMVWFQEGDTPVSIETTPIPGCKEP